MYMHTYTFKAIAAPTENKAIAQECTCTSSCAHVPSGVCAGPGQASSFCTLGKQASLQHTVPWSVTLVRPQ